MKGLILDALYPTYQGEVNVRGMGAPVIFLRLGGCHLRCYKNTLDTLCDTPESLKRNEGRILTPMHILRNVEVMKTMTGIDMITVTGGDPLWNDTELLRELFTGLISLHMTISIETSGTLSHLPYANLNCLNWVFDYKLQSAGVKQPFHLDNWKANSYSYVKFVIFDENDLEEAKRVVLQYAPTYEGTFAFGPFWGGLISSAEIVQDLLINKLLSRKVVINAQLHKLLTHADATDVMRTEIPKLL